MREGDDHPLRAHEEPPCGHDRGEHVVCGHPGGTAEVRLTVSHDLKRYRCFHGLAAVARAGWRAGCLPDRCQETPVPRPGSTWSARCSVTLNSTSMAMPSPAAINVTTGHARAGGVKHQVRPMSTISRSRTPNRRQRRECLQLKHPANDMLGHKENLSLDNGSLMQFRYPDRALVPAVLMSQGIKSLRNFERLRTYRGGHIGFSILARERLFGTHSLGILDAGRAAYTARCARNWGKTLSLDPAAPCQRSAADSATWLFMAFRSENDRLCRRPGEAVTATRERPHLHVVRVLADGIGGQQVEWKSPATSAPSVRSL
jgi:hypothetical protein